MPKIERLTSLWGPDLAVNAGKLRGKQCPFTVKSVLNVLRCVFGFVLRTTETTLDRRSSGQTSTFSRISQ